MSRASKSNPSGARATVALVWVLFAAFSVAHGLVAENAPDARITTQAPVQTSSSLTSQNKKFRWKMGLSGQSFANEKDQAQTVGFGLEGDLKHGLLSTLELRARAGVLLESGYAQSRFGENTPKSGVRLGEAFIQYKPFRPFAIKIGALDQGELGLPLVVAGAFPGIAERILVGNRAFNVELRAQQTVPTSAGLDTKAVETEATPSFMSESLIVRARPFESISLGLGATHFRFAALPRSVAVEGGIHGNTILGSEPLAQRFAFGFDGVAVDGITKVRLGRAVAVQASVQMIRNSQAPESYRDAQLASAELEIALPGDVDLVPRAEVFFAESDVAPSFYNSSEYGHTNRQGWAAELSLLFKQEKFKLGARYVNADLINASEINSSQAQSRQAYVMVRFETLYDGL